MSTIKPPTTYKEQLEKLRSRGCIIRNEDYAIDVLSKVNYYRFFTSIPKDIPELDENNQRSLFAMIMVLRNLYVDSQKWNKEIYTPLVSLINEYKEVIRFSCIGFPDDWEGKLRK
jgi:abortive infection bacteriophage resistance protein